jgi:dTDP-4-amino-4,6-dideoxygalactose transaminase
LQEVLDNTAFAGGRFVERFEKEFAAACSCEYAVGVGSGTAALWAALVALGIGDGDEVITVPNTFIATAEAISMAGAKPVFVDIDEQTYTMDPKLLEAAITPNTKAVIPVHLYGQMADMDSIMEVARARGLHVVEDAAQAHGAEYKARPAGSIGDLGCFSFYPGKNLGAYGEAGAAVTNSEELATRMRMFRDHGQAKKYYHTMVGWNSRMDGFQGAVLSVKLRHLSSWNEGRRKNAELYRRRLGGRDSIVLPTEADYAKHVYHVYAVRVPDRESLMNYLREKEIYCGIHYPVPVHLQEAYGCLGLGRGSYPVTEKSADELISLPMYPELASKQIDYVAEEMLRFLDGE